MIIFLKELFLFTDKLKIGDPLEIETLMGPLINENAVVDYLAAIEKAILNGGKVLYGGNKKLEKVHLLSLQ